MNDESKANMRLTSLSDSEFGLVWMFDELERDKLEEIAHLISDFLHILNVGDF